MERTLSERAESASEKNAKMHATRVQEGGGYSTRTERVAKGVVTLRNRKRGSEREIAKGERRMRRHERKVRDEERAPNAKTERGSTG